MPLVETTTNIGRYTTDALAQSYTGEYNPNDPSTWDGCPICGYDYDDWGLCGCEPVYYYDDPSLWWNGNPDLVFEKNGYTIVADVMYEYNYYIPYVFTWYLWGLYDVPYDSGDSGTGGGGGSSSPPSASAIVSTTLSYTGQFTRGTQRPVTLQTTVFDCSAWVYFVLLKLDPTLANNLGTNTSAMQAYINSHGGYHSTPQVGDLAMWGGHVEFVVSVSGNAIEISGSNGADGSAVPKVSGGSWLTVGSPALNTFGSGGFLGFYTLSN